MKTEDTTREGMEETETCEVTMIITEMKEGEERKRKKTDVQRDDTDGMKMIMKKGDLIEEDIEDKSKGNQGIEMNMKIDIQSMEERDQVDPVLELAPFPILSITLIRALDLGSIIPSLLSGQCFSSNKNFYEKQCRNK